MVGTLRFAHPTHASRHRNTCIRSELIRQTDDGGAHGTLSFAVLLGVPIPILVLIYAFGGLH
jgi:hypothetical protein